jgi:flagellar motor switch protein FliG
MNPYEQKKQMSGPERIAILFRVLGADFAKMMSDLLRPEEVTRIGEAMLRFENTPPSADSVKKTLDDFQSTMSKGGIFANVTETLQELFNAKFGAKDGPRLLSEVRVNSQTDSPFKGLQGVPYPDLERALGEEHPQVQAAVLYNIDIETAAGVLDCMPEERRRAILERIATMKTPPAGLLRDIADIFIEKTKAMPRFQNLDPHAPDPSIKRAADILNAAAGETNSGLLDKMAESSPDLVERIRDTMFTFEDLATVDKRNMQKILAGIDAKMLSLALKACPKQVADSIFASVSERTRDMINEERELLGSVPISDVKGAQKEIMVTIRKLIESGAITVHAGGKGVQLVA